MSNTVFKQSIVAICIGLVGWTAFSMSDVAFKFTSDVYPIHFILMVNGTLGTIISFLWLKLRYKDKAFKTEKLKWHLLRGCIVGINAIFIINAVVRIPLADFYSIAFLSPLLIALVSPLFFDDHYRLKRILTILVGFGGVIILAGPQFSAFNLGIIFAFIVACFLCTGNLIAKKIGPQDPLPLYAFVPFVFIMLINTPIFLFSYEPIEWDYRLIFVIMVPFLVMTGQICISQAFARAPEASIVAPFHYSQLIWGVLFGFFLFGDLPSVTTLAGAFVIIGSGIYLILSEKKDQATKIAHAAE